MQKVFLDTDLNYPSDDFEALCVLAKSKELSLIGIGAAAGNTWSEEVLCNIRTALSILNCEYIPVGKGAEWHKFDTTLGSPSVEQRKKAGMFLGAYGKSPQPRIWATRCSGECETAAKILVDTIRRFPGEVDIVAIAPLTNICAALSIEPNLPKLVRKLYVMGGCFAIGSECVDFNFWFDPTSAAAVFNAGFRVVLVPLNACKEASLMSLSLLENLGDISGGVASIFIDDILGMIRQHGLSLPLCDLITSLIVLDPLLIQTSERGFVEVRESGVECGQSIFTCSIAGNVEVVRSIDSEKAKEMLAKLTGQLRYDETNQSKRFHFPRIQSQIEERMAFRSILQLPSTYYQESWIDRSPEKIESSGRLTELISTLSSLVVKAKESAEIWPPFERADTKTIQNGAKSLDFLTIEEIECGVCNRIMLVDVIATIDDGNSIRGFTCLSAMTPDRRISMERDFGVCIKSASFISEFGLVDFDFRGNRAFTEMNRRLFTWCAETQCKYGEVSIYGVVLESQMASRKTVLKLGYEWIAKRTIPSGFECGKSLDLFCLNLGRSKDCET